MTEERKPKTAGNTPKIENLRQKEPEELTPEEAEQAQGGRITNPRVNATVLGGGSGVGTTPVAR